ncbi:MAG: PD-(D/E)XK nuclease family protein, partial [Clostridia bacterium]|nr:PD-(D/E)XK nuclease family protein [Clostridia bacterium]
IEEKAENDMLRIDLGCNFRSRKEVCSFVNSLFKKLVYTETSDFEYDDKEELVPKAKYPESDALKVENHFVDFGAVVQDETVNFDSKIEAEAYIVADIIEDLVNKEPFLRDSEGLRKARYSDVAILIRSMRGKDEYYINALKERGIPVSISASELLDSDEINSLISILKVINNPSDDIALLTLLTSPLFLFSMNELAEIRAEHKYGSFYSAVLAAAKSGNEKATDFVTTISNLRRRSTVLPISILIDEIFEETNILNIYSNKENGEVKRLNLLCVQNLAVEFDDDKSKDIGSFLRYFNELENRDFSLSNSSEDGVKIMSIHKSKGLQFPICIIANTTNQFNENDIKDSVIVSEEQGFSCAYFDDLGVKKDNFVLRTLMKSEEKRNLLAEELRVFYVALTRAEEMLITLSSYENIQDEVQKKKQLIDITNSKNKVSYSLFRKNKCYADWLLESLLIDGIFTFDGNNDQIIIHKNVQGRDAQNKIEQEKEIVADDESVQKLKEIYSFVYPYEELLSLQAKASVTDIVHKADEKTYRFTTRPSFMQSKGLSSAERGTAMHKVMQMVDYARCRDALDEELLSLYENLVLSQAEYEALDKDLFEKFFHSKLCDRVINAQTVKREMRFITEFRAGELTEGLSDMCANEPIVVQGAVDLLFVENNEIVIVDFKSDRNKNECELVEAYEKQLKIYAKACSKLMNLPVKEMLIYSYSLGKEIKIQ